MKNLPAVNFKTKLHTGLVKVSDLVKERTKALFMDYSEHLASAKDRESLFKDSVIKEARQRADKILRDAQKKQQKILEETKNSCKAITAEQAYEDLQNENAKEFAALILESRKELLLYRKELVDGLFSDVESRIQEFVQSSDYAAWIIKQIKKHEDFINKTSTPEIHIRKADSKHEPAIKKQFPGCKIVYNNFIVLGGVFISNGKIMYNESLDEKLEQEENAFYRKSDFMI